ncbi:hypothetical protein [Sphingomonas sp.]|jgi:hypothetical protein|uniref:hypothetical protein n=1 Tax=Sphingomonas sp. TaxID=28214 RepID=UPI002DE97417|nr:hypothetical protein [Sphingomonas sp.]
MILFLLLQASAPDIEFNANVRARSVTIEKQGDARLTVHAEPEGERLVDVQAPKANGRKTLDNVEVTIRARASVADPQAARVQVESGETSPPQ